VEIGLDSAVWEWEPPEAYLAVGALRADEELQSCLPPGVERPGVGFKTRGAGGAAVESEFVPESAQLATPALRLAYCTRCTRMNRF
jgi:hypothetical protein